MTGLLCQFKTPLKLIITLHGVGNQLLVSLLQSFLPMLGVFFCLFIFFTDLQQLQFLQY